MTEIDTEDLVWGINGIAKVIGRSDRQTYHLLTSGLLPAKQVGSRWVASRKKLIEALIGEAA